MILENVEQFIENNLTKLKELKIDVSHLNLDHIGYQSSSSQNYDNLKAEFNKIGKQISEKIVGGRKVGIYKLNTPLIYKQYIVPAIELIEPKTGQICPSALEHMEFVINDFDEFIKQYPQISWDTSAINQIEFPMIKLKLSPNTQVKFHLTPVLEIVKN